MADLASQFLEAGNAPTNAPADDLAMRFLEIGGQLGAGSSSVNTVPAMRRPPQGIERFARPGFDLDVTSGAPISTRAGLSFRQTPEDKTAYLRNAFSGSSVEEADGNFIIRNVLDPSTGRPKDLLVDEDRATLFKDAADLTAAGLETVAELFVLKGLGRLTEGMGRFGRLATESAAGAGVANLAGGGMEAGARLIDNQPLQMSELALRRLKGAGTQTALGMGMGGVIEGGAGAVDTVTGRAIPGEVERSGIASIQRLNQQFPDSPPIIPTVGQMAASPDVMRFETVMAKMPFIGRLYREPLQQQDEALRGLQQKVIGNEPLTPLADLGFEAAQTVQNIARRPQMEAEGAEISLITRATDELDTAMNRMSPSEIPFTTEGAASLTKLSARNQYDSFRTKADELFEDAGDPIISTAAMKPELDRIRTDLPKKTVVNESELVDVRGKPLATTEAKQVIRELVPDKLNRLMSGLDQIDPQMPLSELRRIRSTIDSAIVDGRGLPEVSTYELKQLQGAITRTIDQGVKALGDSDVAKKLSRANKFYREEIDRFEVPLISRLLKKDPNQPGFIDANELLSTIQANPDAYRNLETFMRSGVTEGGQAVSQSASRQFNVLRRSLTEEMFSRARTAPGQRVTTLDADVVLNELNQLKPAVRASLLGGEARTITRNLELLSQLKKGYKDVPEDALRNFLNRPNNSVQDLSRLATAVKKERDVFSNGLLKKFLDGGVGSDALPPEKITDWLLNAQKTSEVSDFMAKIGDNPQLVDKIRRHYLVGFLQKNRAPTKSSEAARLGDPSEALSSAKLIDALKDQKSRHNLRAILGDETFNFLNNLAGAQSVLGKAGDSGASTMGGIAATTQILDVLKMVKNPTAFGQSVLTATILSNRNLRQAIMEQSLQKPLSTKDFTRLIISSAPMVEALAEDLGKTGAELILSGFQTE